MLAAVGFSYLLGCFLGGFLPENWLPAAVLAACGVLCCLLPFCRKAPLFPLSAGAAAAALAVCLAVSLSAGNDVSLAAEQEDPEWTGLVEECGVRYGAGEYTLLLRGGPLNGKRVQLTSYEILPVSPGDVLAFTAELRAPEDGLGFTEKSRARARGISFLGAVGEYRTVGREENGFVSIRTAVTDYFSRILEDLLPLDAAYLTETMLLGDSGKLDPVVKENFRKAGGSHMLVVSGMHLSVLASVLSGLLFFLRKRAKLRHLLLMAGVLALMAVTGFRYSVLRAGFMYLLFLLGEMLGRESDPISSLGVSAFCICLIHPGAGGDIGFLLSFSATLGILLYAPRCKAWLEPRLGRVGKNRAAAFFAEQAVISLCACVFTVPLSMYAFGSASLLTVFTGVLLALPCSVIISLGFVFCLLGGWFAPLLRLPAILAALMCRFCCWYAAAVPDWAYPAAGELSLLAAAGVLAVFLLAVRFRGSRKTAVTGGVCCGCIVLAAVLLTVFDSSVTLSLTDYGSGYRAELRDGSGLLILQTGSSTREESPHSLREELEWSSPHCRAAVGEGRAVAEIYGKTVTFQENTRFYREESCDIFVSRYPKEEVSAPLTILLGGGAVEEELLPAGNYVIGENNLRIRFFSSGRIRLERF